jgi:hypothetical protein
MSNLKIINSQTITDQNQYPDSTVYMLTYDHGGLILWGSDHFRERLENAIEWLDKYPTFKIGLDNEAQIYDYFAENEPALLEELTGYLEKYKGRFAIGSCTYGQPLSQFINEESNIRQIYYAVKACQEHFNYRPPVYLMSEHAMHSQIPQILNGFDFDGAIMRTHFMMYGYNPTFDVPIGWWKGLDGSTIATIPTYPGEGAEFGKTPVDNWILTRYPGPECSDSMEVFRKQFIHIHPLLASRADDSGLRREGLVSKYENNPQYQWILLDELMDIFPEPEMEMVTLPNDFTVRMPWGYCGNEIWNGCRKAEVQVLTAERLASLEFLHGGQSYEQELEESWKNLLLAQHHDVQIVGLLPEAHKLLPASIHYSEEVIQSAMNYFALNMSGTGIRQVTVFNPHSWPITRWITTDIALSKGEAGAFVVRTGNMEIPVRIISAHRFSDESILEGRIAFKAELPPLSITSFSVIPSDGNPMMKSSEISVDEENMRIINPFIEIKLSQHGGIESIRNVVTGEFITGKTERSGFFAGTINGTYCESAGRWIIHRSGESTPWVEASEYGFISDIPYHFEITVYEDSPQIDCKVEFSINGQKIGLLSDNKRDSHSPFVHNKKLRFKFFPNIDEQAAGIRDLPFAIAETMDSCIEGNYWTALSDGKIGIAFFNKGTMGSIRESDGSLSIPLAYAMYYIWGTRMLYGNYSYEFAIYPFAGQWEKTDLHKSALEYNFPVPVVATDPGNGKPGNRVDLLSSGSDHVILSALYPSAGKVYIRFYEYKGLPCDISLPIFKEEKSITEVNLMGTTLNQVSETIHFNPWQIKTFRIE